MRVCSALRRRQLLAGGRARGERATESRPCCCTRQHAVTRQDPDLPCWPAGPAPGLQGTHGRARQARDLLGLEALALAPSYRGSCAGLCWGMTLGTAVHAGLLMVVWLRTVWQARPRQPLGLGRSVGAAAAGLLLTNPPMPRRKCSTLRSALRSALRSCPPLSGPGPPWTASPAAGERQSLLAHMPSGASLPEVVQD